MKVVHAIHDFLPRHRAGSEIYAFHLCRELSRLGHDVGVVCAEYDPAREHGSIAWREYEGLRVAEIVNNWAFASFRDTYASPVLNRALERVLLEVRPDVLHVHNLLNLSMDLPRLAAGHGIRTVATLHDYTLVCPSGGQRVHASERHVCHDIDPDRCARCFGESPFASQMAVSGMAAPGAGRAAVLKVARTLRRHVPQAFDILRRGATAVAAAQVTRQQIMQRLEEAKRVFDDIDLFLAPSASLAAEYQRLGMPPWKIRVSDYGFVPFDVPVRQPSARLRIGYVGTIGWHKGVHVLLQATAALPPDTFEIRLFGDPDVFPAYTEELRSLARHAPVRFMGPFDEGRRGEVYAQMDVLVVPSLWPENSPLVIHEAFMAGVPVVGSNLGGTPGLVTHDVSGFIYEAFSPEALRAALQRLLDDRTLLQRFAGALPAVKSIEQDATDWEAVYCDLAVRGPAAKR